jgi:ABC-type dipeptide/oligopeptide/nickel transport system permease subunit
MAELEGDLVESADEAQAVKARFNPWWVVGAFIFIVAVVLGFRSLRKAKKDVEPPAVEGDA